MNLRTTLLGLAGAIPDNGRRLPLLVQSGSRRRCAVRVECRGAGFGS